MTLFRNLLLNEEYGVNLAVREQGEFKVDIERDWHNDQVFIIFKEDIGRFRLRGILRIRDEDTDAVTKSVPFEALSTIDSSGNLSFKVPGTPLMSSLDEGDRLSISRLGKEAVRQVYTGETPNRPSVRDIILTGRHTTDRLVQTAADQFTVVPRAISNQERFELNQELTELEEENENLEFIAQNLPGTTRTIQYMEARSRVDERLKEIRRLLRIQQN